MNAEDRTHMKPADVTSRSFNSRRRGLDRDEVHEHLRQVADAMRTMNMVIADLEMKVEERDAEIADAAALSTPALLDLDDETLHERLDEEMQELIRSARREADEARVQADVDAAAILAEAEQLYATRSLVADEEAARKRSEASAIRDQRLAEIDHEIADSTRRAEVELAALNDQIASNRRDAEAEANRLVSEAQVVRRQILEDLTRRRNTARRQIEQLRAGRDRLLASHEIVRKALDEVTNELTISMVEARAAAETAGHGVSDSSTEELEAEIETARLSGLLDTGPVPVVDDTPEPNQPENQHDDQPEDDNEPEENPEPETQTIVPSAEERLASDVVDSADEASPKVGDPIAPVVDLDTARPVVDTGSHPAAGRNTTVSSSPPIPRLAAVAPDLSAEDDDPTVEDLFARMRASREAAANEPDTAKSTTKKKTPPKKKASAKKKSPAKKKTPEVDLAPVVADLNRQLKRVLADEQSSVLSSLLSVSSIPDIDTLLGSSRAHQDRYWSVALVGVHEASELIESHQGTAPSANEGDLRIGLDTLVEELRSSVSKSLEKADDSDSMIADLRTVYRQVKTRRIGVCVDDLCDSLNNRG